jgi:hypothetical protein
MTPMRMAAEIVFPGFGGSQGESKTAFEEAVFRWTQAEIETRPRESSAAGEVARYGLRGIGEADSPQRPSWRSKPPGILRLLSDVCNGTKVPGFRLRADVIGIAE